MLEIDVKIIFKYMSNIKSCYIGILKSYETHILYPMKSFNGDY